MEKIKWSAVALAAFFCLNACQTKVHQETSGTVAGINLQDMDTTVSPRDDFYIFANGGWLQNTEIPADQGKWSAFHELVESNNETLLGVLKNAQSSGKYKEGSDERKAAVFYEVGMDSLKAEKKGIEPLQLFLTKIDGINSAEDLQNAIVELRRNGISVFFGAYVGSDRKFSDQTAMHVYQGGINLPNRDYYIKEDAKSKEIRLKYVEYIADMLQHIGYDQKQASDAAKRIMKLETELAKASMDNVQRRDPELTYNKFALKELDKLSPNFRWPAYFKQLNADPVDSVIVGQPEFLKKMNEIIGRKDLTAVKDYLKFNVINHASPYLNHEIVNRNFLFYGKVLNGTDEMRARWKRVLAMTDRSVGFALGKLYVDEVFPPSAKENCKEMVEYIKLAFADRIRNLDWMTDETKKRALEKLTRFNVKIGYPDNWKTYEDLEIGESSYIENIYASNRFSVRENLDKLGKPVDKTEWFMTPQTVNAYYSPTFNEIVFPAGILQPPFYNFRADAAVNFGGIGAVIGHEISHGFDDNGSKYDGDGNMKNWWTEEDREQFEARTQKLVEQFSSYQPLDSIFVDGKFTLGENIGDLGGVAAAYDGLLLYLKRAGRPDEILGFTPEQRFFISWATVWRTKYKEEALRNQIITDPHAPGMYRATGPLVNIDGFFEAFNIQEGDKMYKPESERVRIW